MQLIFINPRCFIMVTQGRLLQTPSGVQEVTPSTQQMFPASFKTARAFVLHHHMAVQTAIPSMQLIALAVWHRFWLSLQSLGSAH